MLAYCRALEPVILPTETGQVVKERLLNFVRSLSTVLAFAYCLSRCAYFLAFIMIFWHCWTIWSLLKLTIHLITSSWNNLRLTAFAGWAFLPLLGEQLSCFLLLWLTVIPCIFNLSLLCYFPHWTIQLYIFQDMLWLQSAWVLQSDIRFQFTVLTKFFFDKTNCAICSVIQQAQKFLAEGTDASETRNVCIFAFCKGNFHFSLV